MKYRFKGNFLYYVRLIKKLNENMLERAAKQCGLSIQEADVLSFLRENPEFDTACDVALYREVSRAYVSKAVELLEQRGYLSISRDEADRRKQRLKITDTAKAVAEALHEAQSAFYNAVTANLTEEEIKTMLAIIGKCAENVAAETKLLNIKRK
jgi:MarR family transcriptional regulator for hemolysin